MNSIKEILTESTIPNLKRAAAEWEALSAEERAAQEREWDEQTARERQDQLTKWRRWDATQTPGRFQDASLEDFDPGVTGQVKAWVEMVCDDPEYRGLLIAGPTGVGKTRLMWALYHELSSRSGPRMEVVKLVRLLSSLRPSGDAPDDAMNKLCSVPILAIDDIGTQKSSEWVNERLYEIIDTRYDNCKPIIATTNRKHLTDALADDRLVSRLEECCELIVMTGPDRRTRA